MYKYAPKCHASPRLRPQQRSVVHGGGGVCAETCAEAGAGFGVKRPLQSERILRY